MKKLLLIVLLAASAQAEQADWRFSTVPGAGGVPLNVVETGKRGNPGILFLHGFSQSALSWEAQLGDAGLQDEFHLVAFDLRGHGNSGKPWRREDYSPAAWSQDIAAVIDATQLERPLIVAWSFGGQVVMHYLRERGSAQAAGLQLVGSVGRLAPRVGEMPPLDQEWVGNMLSSDMRANILAGRHSVRRLTADEMPADWVDRTLWTYASMPVYAKLAIGISDESNADLSPRLRLPVRLSGGEHDQLVNPDTMRSAAAALPDASVRVYEDVGHSPFIEAPTAFNRDLTEFARAAHAATGPGAVFADCDGCPEMVVVPSGEFLMGSNDGESDRPEGPIHKVTITRAFALGRYEITNAQFRAFVEATGHETADACNRVIVEEGVLRQRDPGVTWRDPAYGRPPADDEPVACVSWNDATAYVNWLSAKTGIDYRLPSESEWEFAARAGAATAYPWGDDPGGVCRYGNVYDTSAYHPKVPFATAPCDDGFPGVSPIGSYEPNAFGLYDTVGNVWEWVQDCYVVPYPDESVDESPIEVDDCDRRGVKGGSWRTVMSRQRPAFRGRDPADLVTQIFGFRVARDLP